MHKLRLLLCLALSLAASSPLAGADRLRVEGSDTIGGSLGIELAEAFHAFHPEVLVEWEGLGSSTAFIGLFDGSADLGASSRPINENELAEAKKLGLKLKEAVLAYDGLSIFVHPSNEIPVLTVEQLSRIFQGRVTNFREVGGPDRPIRLLSRPSYSGTHAFFRDKVLRRGNARGPEEFAATTEWMEHTADLVERVARNPNAITYGGMAYARPKVKVVPVALVRGRPGVLPTAESVRDGSYPIFRPLYLYSRGEPSGRLGELMGFILGIDGQKLVAEVGFVPATLPQVPPAALARSIPPPRPATAASLPRSPGSVAPEAAAVAVRSAAPAPTQPPTTASLASPLEPTRVYFLSGAVELGPGARTTLADLARALTQPGRTAKIVGHTDANGSREGNLRVASARAQAVYRELRRLGVPAGVMTVEGAGSDKPVASNESDAGRASNRRVDVVIYE